MHCNVLFKSVTFFCILCLLIQEILMNVQQIGEQNKTKHKKTARPPEKTKTNKQHKRKQQQQQQQQQKKRERKSKRKIKLGPPSSRL